MPHNPIETQATHSDSDILALLNARREEGLQLLEQRYGKTLFSLARRLLGDRRDAEECLNDVRLAVWNAIPPAHPASLLAFLLSLTRRRAIDTVRRRTADKRAPIDTLSAELCDILPEDTTPESELENLHIRETVNRYLAGLPDRRRRVFISRYYLAESEKVIAAREGMSRAAVAMLLARMRQELKAKLEEEDISL